MLALICATANAADAEGLLRGRQLFEVGTSLTASLRGDSTPLPTLSLRCANCHRRVAPPLGSPSKPDEAGPVLNAATLLQATSRRGGPPSRYGEVSFCRTIATGIDSADVMLRRTMPLYVIGPQDCRALWRFLTDEGSR